MKKRSERGNSIIEFSFMAPWLIFMFVGAMDWGFYAYALIATESAARVVACTLSASASTATDTTTVCNYAIGQLKRMANVGTSVSSRASGTSVSAGSPGGGLGDRGLPDPMATLSAAQVSVTYLTPVYIPMVPDRTDPRSQTGNTITRTIQMRLRG